MAEIPGETVIVSASSLSGEESAALQTFPPLADDFGLVGASPVMPNVRLISMQATGLKLPQLSMRE